MKNGDKKLELLSISYSRQYSKAHTTFSSWVEAMIGITIGYIGVILSYLQIYNIPLDKFKLISLLLVSIILGMIISFVAFFVLYHSRVERKDIVRKIKELNSDRT